LQLNAIIFDHDGTLVDSEGTHFEIWYSILQEHGVEFLRDDYRNHHCGVPTLRNAQMLVDKHNLSISAEALYREKQSRLHRWLESNTFPLLPYVREALDYCRSADLQIAMATGAGQREAWGSINGHNLNQYFTAVATKNDVETSKPAPDVYLLALELLGLSREQCIAIEDSYTGVSSAKAAGLRCITVVYPLARQQDLSAADHHSTNLLEAVELALTLSD